MLWGGVEFGGMECKESQMHLFQSLPGQPFEQGKSLEEKPPVPRGGPTPGAGNTKGAQGEEW